MYFYSMPLITHTNTHDIRERSAIFSGRNLVCVIIFITFLICVCARVWEKDVNKLCLRVSLVSAPYPVLYNRIIVERLIIDYYLLVS